MLVSFGSIKITYNWFEIIRKSQGEINSTLLYANCNLIFAKMSGISRFLIGFSYKKKVL